MQLKGKAAISYFCYIFIVLYTYSTKSIHSLRYHKKMAVLVTTIALSYECLKHWGRGAQKFHHITVTINFYTPRMKKAAKQLHL